VRAQVHRIGRTGRCGKTGIATTFINKNQSESILLDLKHLLKVAMLTLDACQVTFQAPAADVGVLHAPGWTLADPYALNVAPLSSMQEAKQRIPPVLMALDDPMDKLEELEAVSGTKVLRMCAQHRAEHLVSCSVTYSSSQDLISTSVRI
jgi:ATP-dependent RNA helicase DDX41